MLDLFGLGKEEAAKTPPILAEKKKEAKSHSRRFWLAWLTLDSLLVLASAFFLAETIYQHQGAYQTRPILKPPQNAALKSSTQPTPVAVLPQTQPTTPRPAAAAQPPSRAPAPSVKTPGQTAAPKIPIGSPSVNAPELPQRRAEALASPGSKKAAPESSSKPVDFTYIDPNAERVALMGPFLVRTGGRREMKKDASGAWRTSVYLKTGATYRYRFEVSDKDGKKRLTPRKTVDVP